MTDEVKVETLRNKRGARARGPGDFLVVWTMAVGVDFEPLYWKRLNVGERKKPTSNQISF